MLNRAALILRMRDHLDCMLASDARWLEHEMAVRLTENGETVGIGAGLFQSALSIGFQQFFADADAQQVGCFATLQTREGPRILALRLALKDARICESEAIIARPGGHPLFAPKALTAPLPIYDDVVPAPERRPRHELVRIANLYFDAIEQANGRVAPIHAACNRRENGVVMTNNPALGVTLNCQDGIDRLTYIPRVRERRFPVVDEQLGLVWALVIFDMPTQQRSMRLAELFKIAGGEIREIEAVLINTPLGATAGW